MTPRSKRTYISLGVALAMPAALSLWILAVPGVMSISTYTALTALLLGITAVTLISVRNAGPTGSLGQLLYATEHRLQRDATRDATRNVSW